MSTFNDHNTSKIALPSSIALANTLFPTQTITNRQRISSVSEHDNRLSSIKKKQQIKDHSSHLSKSHSMHRLDQNLVSGEQDDEKSTKQMHQVLFRRATTMPTPRPSSLIKRFSEHTTTDKQTTSIMKRSQSLVNPLKSEEITNGGGLVATSNFKLGQQVSVPCLNVTGTIRFYGETKFKREAGHWIGIELDVKGAGKNDGSIQGYSI